MAQPIRCDYAGHDHLADVMVTNLENGETLAWCGAAYLELCAVMVDAAAVEAASETDADAIDRLEHVEAPGLAGAGDPDGEGGDAPAPDNPPLSVPAPTTVVRRGTSRKARAAQARRERALAAVLQVGTGVLAGPDDDEDDDEDEAIPAEHAAG